MAKWLATQPRIFILDGPTVGIDIASKAEIYKMIHNTAEKGIGIILISDEISEVLHNCDRILIMKEGQIIHTVDPKSANEDKVLALAR